MTQYSGKVIRKTPVTPTQQSASGVWKLNEQAAAIRNNSWPVPGVPDPISRSVRLRNSASAYLNKSFSTSRTSNAIATFSAWVKRGTLGAAQSIFGGYDGSSAAACQLVLDSGNVLSFDSGGSASTLLTTTQVFRDPSAWYHIVLAVDTSQATASNRVKLYINGTQVTAFSASNYPTLNQTFQFALANANNRIGSYYSGANYFDGYLTEINFIDGQALTPSSFGTTDPASGAWIPMPYTGTYGANGFYLNFKDNTSTTTLGLDYSGNANNWTANNISLTAGTTYDSMLDVPTPWVGYSTTTDTSAVTRGNYCTLNAVSTGRTLSEGNLNYAAASSGIVKGTIGVSSGKWYWEVTAGNGSPTSNSCIGICDINLTPATSFLGNTSNSWGYAGSATKYNNGTGASYGASYASGDIIGVAFDADAGTLTFYKNNVSQGQAYSGITGSSYCPAAGNNTLNDYNGYHNFGQRPFTYTPPSGYKALCTTNLPTPTITNGANYMAATLYTGTGSAFTLTGVGFQPDLGWFKGRNASSSHWLHDVVRGANPGLSSNSTAAEDTTAGQLTSFASDGYSLPNDTAGYLNYSGRTMVVWSWKASGTTSSNTSGSITSTVSVNTTAGFSVVTYTGTGANATVGHGLGVAPSMVIVKARDTITTNRNWAVWHTGIGGTDYLLLNLTNAKATSATVFNGAPTSSVFNIGTDIDVSQSTNRYVAYCWAAVAGYSAFGSYTGNGSSDGPFVYCGFRPRYVMVKISSGSTGSWWIWDSSRNTYNAASNLLAADTSGAEISPYNCDLLSNGFKLRDATGALNGNTYTFIYAAFAESPFKFSNAR